MIFAQTSAHNQENSAIDAPFESTDHVVNMIQAY